MAWVQRPIRVETGLALRFKQKCDTLEVSQSEVIRDLMEQWSGIEGNSAIVMPVSLAVPLLVLALEGLGEDTITGTDRGDLVCVMRKVLEGTEAVI